MRSLPGLILIACVLGLVGCNLPKRLKGGSGGSGSGSGQPFVGSPSSDPPAETSEVSADTLASKKSGQPGRSELVGTVLDTAGRRVAKAEIKVVEDEPAKDAAPHAVLTDRSGYFTVPGLDEGKWYQLTARVRDGNRYLLGTVRVRAPNVRVLIALSREEAIPGGDKASVEEKTEKTSTSSAAASLLAPVPTRPAHQQQPPPSTPAPFEEEKPAPRSAPQPPGPETVSPELLATDKNRAEGWDRASPTVTIPNGPGQPPKKSPSNYMPPPPPGDEGPRPSAAPSAVPEEKSIQREESPSAARAVVPSCVRVGERVENFALYDFDGQPWELKKKRQGKVVLLDFWFAGCPPCKKAIPFLNKLDRDYRRFGLQVVGVANEKGTLAEKQDLVRPVREDYRMSYPTLFSGGGDGDCPVLKQMEIQEYPTLILLDQGGKVIWRGSGLDEWAKYYLEMRIRRQVGLR